jgi:6-pyruvoyltetrahydropterin/6-carboxytetrahydropterin synthase
MAKIRVTKEFHFEMAHVLWNYDGPCRNVHGHSYKLFVTVIGSPVDDPENPRNGMVIDFTELKRIVREEIVTVFDHSVVVSRFMDESRLEQFKALSENTVVLDYQPTCENLVADFAAKISANLPDGTDLYSVKLYETATSFAEWYADDNQ